MSRFHSKRFPVYQQEFYVSYVVEAATGKQQQVSGGI